MTYSHLRFPLSHSTPADATTFDGQFILCETTCRGEECEEFFLDRNFMVILGRWRVSEEPYGEIQFRCSGEDDVNMVDGGFIIVGSEDTGEVGSCSGTGTDAGANMIFGELNVHCPDGTGNWSFVNDDYYVECQSGTW